MKNDEKAALKRYIDNYLERFLTIPIDIYATIIRNFPTDYDLKELTGMLNLHSTVVNSLDKVVEDSNIDLFVDNLTEANHPDLGYFWNLLSKTYAEFSQPVIDKYVDKWDWNVISELNPSDEFIKTNLTNINWGFVPCSEKTLEFFQEYENVINFDKVDWGSLEWTVIEAYIHKIKEIKFKTKEEEKGLNYGSCNNDFIEKYKEFVPTMTYMEILSRSMDNVPTDWESTSVFFQLDEEFINDMSHRVNWDLISIAQNMSLDLMLKFKDKIKPENLALNVKISQEIKDEFLAQRDIEEIAPIVEEVEETEVEETKCDCENCDEECDDDEDVCETFDDGSQTKIFNIFFTDEKLEKEINYTFDFTDKNISKMKDFSDLLESVRLTYGSIKEIVNKNIQGSVKIKFVVKDVDMDTLKEEIDEFLEDRGWGKK